MTTTMRILIMLLGIKGNMLFCLVRTNSSEEEIENEHQVFIIENLLLAARGSSPTQEYNLQD